MTGCAAVDYPQSLEGCKSRAFINGGLLDYLKTRYHSQPFVRFAIIPFDVQESFALPGNESEHYGRELARRFQAEIQRSGELGIVELFNQDRWPGKREEFFTGNHRSIQLARDAGYDMVILGYLEDLRNDEELPLLTKVIDTSNGVTVWFGRTVAYSRRRPVRELFADARLAQKRPELFAFTERTEKLVRCTVSEILYASPLEPGVDQPKR